MKNLSIKTIVLVIAMATTIMSCKKLDGPEPDTRQFLTAKSWDAVSVQDPSTGMIMPVNSANCNGLVFQFANNGIFYEGNGCDIPSQTDTWVITDKTISFPDASQYVITTIDASTLIVKSDSDEAIFTFTSK